MPNINDITATNQIDTISSTNIGSTGFQNLAGLGGNDTITGTTTLKTRTQNGAAVPDTYVLQVARVIYDVSDTNNKEVVELMWEGNGGGANNRTIVTLSGKGVLEFDTHGARIPNNANNATGNIILTTNQWDTKSAYTIVIDVNKYSGYAQPFLQRNVLGRY